MLSDSLARFNIALEQFRENFPRTNWTKKFKSDLINDFTFFSSKIEDDSIQYGDTIKYLNDQLIRKGSMKSLLDVSNHKTILETLINQYDTFKLSEGTVKRIHENLMQNESSWETEFKKHLVGEYRNIPTIGNREPFFRNKEYVPHFNIEVAMASHMEIFNQKIDTINNNDNNTHILTVLAHFHNVFLNEIHPFADGNGRVCRIIMGTILMKNNCPPIFVKITSEEDRFDYISKIVECENSKTNKPLIDFLAIGMAEYMESKLRNTN